MLKWLLLFPLAIISAGVVVKVYREYQTAGFKKGDAGWGYTFGVSDVVKVAGGMSAVWGKDKPRI